MKRLTLLWSLLGLAMLTCTTENTRTIDVQGHRGARGLMPENTIAGFLLAQDIGVTTLEMDLVISGDGQVVVSHEPFFSHEISIAPGGKEISEVDEKEHNIYRMNYAQIAQYDVGTKDHPRFPHQKKIKASKPLLSTVIAAAEEHAKQKGLKQPRYNIEIKRNPENDSIYHPPADEFARLVVNAVKRSGINERITIQSFDQESLRIVGALDSEIERVMLVEQIDDATAYLSNMPFVPDTFSPDYTLVTPNLVQVCNEINVQLIPWTVNEEAEMEELIKLGVHGIITDYPDRLMEVLEQIGVKAR